jgi:hypothetical protein
MTKDKMRLTLFLSSAVLLRLLFIGGLALTRWEADSCHKCGSRIESAKIFNVRVASVQYQTKLRAFLAAGGNSPDSCHHERLEDHTQGGWELFLTEHPFFAFWED